MQAINISNLFEIDSYIEEFLQTNEKGIKTLHNIYFHNNDKLSISALIAELMDELRTGCVSFFNKQSPIEELNSYLFYIVNAVCKKKATQQSRPKKKTEYLCPGCLFIGKENLIEIINKTFRCSDCESELKSTNDPKKIVFYRTFFKHNKHGYRCADCERFIPHPLDESPIVLCPYYDCCFVGRWASLKRMHHPNAQRNVEILTLDAPLNSDKQFFKDIIVSSIMDPQSQMEVQETLNNKIKVLKEVIETQNNNVPYSSSDFTVKHKYLVYESFNNLLEKYPSEMVPYLLEGSRSGGFQHKIFQEYIKLLENSLPFSFKKGNKEYKVESLLDENLSIFDGISVFDALVSNKLDIKNETKEFYIGGRKASITKPYYIGKLLNIIDSKTKNSLMNKVIEYSFSKIKMTDIAPGTEVVITHLRVPPHYQMCGMVHINRIRKKIVDRALGILNKEDESKTEYTQIS